MLAKPITDGFKAGAAALGRVAAAGLGLAALVVVLSWGAWGMSGDATGATPGMGADPGADPGAVMEPPRLDNGFVVREWTPPDPEAWGGFTQAPMLDRAVKRGVVPAVDQRLPSEPLVVIPPQQEGPYGGALRRYATSLGDASAGMMALFEETLVRFSPSLDGLRSNLAKRWEVKDQGRTFVFELRRGVRWSDGEPFTADDIVFWAEHVLSNPKLTPVVPPMWQSGDGMVEVRKLDKYTFRLHYAEPHSLLLYRLAGPDGFDPLRYAAHRFKRFHPDFTPKAELDKRVAAAGFDQWYRLFQDRSRWFTPTRPTLNPWRVRTPPPGQPIVLQRNPYYWKVDPAGRQLPYIDRIEVNLFDEELIAYRLVQGQADFQLRHVALERYPLLARHQKDGKYRLLHWVSTSGAGIIMPNMTPPDPGLAAVLDDRRVRVALSLAIDRERINQVAFFGVGKPRQVGPPEFSPLYDPDLATLHTEHDPDRANRLLDEAGLTRRDDDGYRIRPDGQPLTLVIENTEALIRPDVLQLVAEDWRAVGVRTQTRVLARSLYYARGPAALQDVATGAGGVLLRPMLNNQYLIPNSSVARYGTKYYSWFKAGGERGVQPPAPMQKAMSLYHQLERTIDPQQQRSLTRRILRIGGEQRWTIGLLAGLFQPVVLSNRMRNVPEHSVLSWGYPGVAGIECFAIQGAIGKPGKGEES